MANAIPRPANRIAAPPLDPGSAPEKNKFQYLCFNGSKGLVSAFMDIKCECKALAAKIGILALPILLLVEALLAITTFPFVWIANQLCKDPSTQSVLVPPPLLRPNTDPRLLFPPPPLPLDPLPVEPLPVVDQAERELPPEEPIFGTPVVSYSEYFRNLASYPLKILTIFPFIS